MEAWLNVGLEGEEAAEPDLLRGVTLEMLPPCGELSENGGRRGEEGPVRDWAGEKGNCVAMRCDGNEREVAIGGNYGQESKDSEVK